MNLLLIPQLYYDLVRLRRRARWTRVQLQAHQERALARLRTHAYERSPFYQRFHRKLGGRPLHELPVLTKALLMEHFDELVTDPAVRLAEVQAFMAMADAGQRYLGRYWVNATSGSSGQPGVFLFGPAEWRTVLASFARAHEWAGVRISLRQRMRMASVASTTPWHMSSQVAATVGSAWMPALRLAASAPLDEIVLNLNRWQPELLVAYASMARLLAEEQRAGRLHIAPRLIFTSSEVLPALARRVLEETWGPHVFNEYAATESGGLAAECAEQRRWHLLEDLVLVEVVDSAYQPVPAGVYGEKVLLTTLFSRTQPLIRYELSDSICLSAEPCPCGKPFGVVMDVQGRQEDVLELPGVTGGLIRIQPLVFHSLLDRVQVAGWQVRQDEEGLTVLLRQAGPDLLDEVLREVVEQALARQGALVPPVTIRRVDSIPQGPGGKTHLVVRATPDAQPSPVH